MEGGRGVVDARDVGDGRDVEGARDVGADVPEKARAVEEDIPDARDVEHGERLLYLVCVFGGAAPVVPGPRVEPEAAATVVSWRDLNALVNLVPSDTYSSEALARLLRNPKWLFPRAARHDAAIRRVMEAHPVLPARFGTVFRSPASLTEALRSWYRRIHRYLDEVGHAEEWGLKVYAGVGAGGPAGDPSPAEPSEPPRGGDGPPGSGGGRDYLLEKRRRRDASRRAERRLAALAEGIFEEAGARSQRARRNPVFGTEGGDPRGRMILNAAFLVRRGDVPGFRRRLAGLARAHEVEGLRLEESGPWPPYNFCPRLEPSA